MTLGLYRNCSARAQLCVRELLNQPVADAAEQFRWSREVVDTEAGAEGQKKAPTLVSVVGCWRCMQRWTVGVKGHPRSAEIVDCLRGVKGGYLEEVDLHGAEFTLALINGLARSANLSSVALFEAKSSGARITRLIRRAMPRLG